MASVVVCSCLLVVCSHLLVVCGYFLVVCGRFLVVGGRLLVVCGRLRSFVVVACFSNYGSSPISLVTGLLLLHCTGCLGYEMLLPRKVVLASN